MPGAFFAMIGIAMVAFMAIVVPIWIIAHYATRWRAARILSPEDEHMIEELWETLPKLESRINSLERILDDEAPDWRKRI